MVLMSKMIDENFICLTTLDREFLSMAEHVLAMLKNCIVIKNWIVTLT